MSAMCTFLAESYLHHLDPFAVQFTEHSGLRWYGISYAAGFLIGWWMLRRLARRRRTPLTVTAVGDLMFYVIAGVLVGGRLGYALFYDQALFVGFTPAFPFWKLLAITQGGMSSHGGMIGVIAGCLLFARRRAVPCLHLLDLVAFACPPGLCLGRLANFVNGELWGRPLPASMQHDPPWWSIKYPQEILHWALDPAQAGRLEPLKALRGVVGGDQTFYEGLVAIARDASQHAHAEVVSVMQPLLTAFYPSQIFQSLAEGPLLLGALVLIWWRPRRPGVVGSWFLVVYGVLRTTTEMFRQPDPGVALLLERLSRGQTLSVVMIAAGGLALWACARRRVDAMGGLGTQRRIDAGRMKQGG